MRNEACMYLRLSRDDGALDESNSISSQRELIRAYAKNNGFEIAREYVDDGISGATFNRPSFKRMIDDLEKGEIHTIVVKDLSRFGRDYIETGKYLQQIFPEKNIRFISINDNYDSFSADTNDTHLILPIRNFINDSYCRDISMKVKSSQQMKRQNGEFIGAFAPFGYMKNPKNKHELIIDKKVKPIIVKIFDMKIEGYSSSAIAKYLNDLGAVTPAKHKEDTTGSSVGFTAKKSKWNAKMVNRIISNKVYIGTLEQGKQAKLNYKSSKRIKILEEDWIVTENAHQAIITRSKFEVANSMLLRDMNSRGEPSLFSGLLFCKDCGSQLVRRNVKHSGKTTIFYICGNNNTTGECSRHSVKEDDLREVMEKIIFDYLRYHESVYRRVLSKDINSFDFKAETDDLKNEKKKYETLRASLFMDLEDDLINEEEFGRFRANYATKIKKIDTQIENKEKLADELKEQILNRQWLIDLEYFKENSKLDRLNLVYLVDKILVEEDKKLTIVFWGDEKLKVMEEILKRSTPDKVIRQKHIIPFPFKNEMRNREVMANG